MTSPIVISISNASKKFKLKQDTSIKDLFLSAFKTKKQSSSDFWALQNVNVEIRAGETIGLIGHNGSGKSTLLKLIGGIIDPTYGTVKSRGRLAALLELGAGFHPDLSGKDNVFLNAALLGMTREETEARYEEIVSFAGIPDFMNTQVKFYSSGMFIRLAFSVAIHTEPDILIIDEVLAVGDEAFQWRCFNKINEFKEKGCTIVLVSHALDQVQQLCDRALLLDRGNVVFDGRPVEAVRAFRSLQLEDMKTTYGSIPGEQSLFGFDNVEITKSGLSKSLIPGEPWSLKFTLVSRLTVELVNVAVSLETLTGQQVSGFTSHGRKNKLNLKPGTNNFEVSFPKGIMLGGGNYYIALMLLDKDGNLLSTARQILSLNFSHSPSSWGYVSTEVQFSRIS